MQNSTANPTLRGHFLIAMPSLQDGFFARAVTYLCEHNDEGAMGLVINQPIDLTWHQLLRHVDLEPGETVPERRVFRGGPVQPEHGFVLHSADERWVATRAVSEKLALTTSRDILEAIAKGRGPRQVLIALGYAGWGPGQLEHELAENAWLVVPADDNVLFDLPAERRWDAATRLMGIDVNLISQEAGHA